MEVVVTTGAIDDGSGGNNWSYRTCKAPVISSPPTNQHTACYRPDDFLSPINSVKALKGMLLIITTMHSSNLRQVSE